MSKFLPGNPGGPGNPLSKSVHRYRMAVREAVTPEELRELFRDLFLLAKGKYEAPMVDIEGRPVLDEATNEQRMGLLPPQGWAHKELYDRLLGRAPQGIYQSDETGESIDAKDARMAVQLLQQFGLGHLVHEQIKTMVDQPEALPGA